MNWNECTTEYDTYRTALIIHVATQRTFYVEWTRRIHNSGRIVDWMTSLSERVEDARVPWWQSKNIHLLDQRIEHLTDRHYDNPDELLNAAEMAVLLLVGEPAEVTAVSGYTLRSYGPWGVAPDDDWCCPDCGVTKDDFEMVVV